jgi:F420-dependent oxidoreductase-like protein
MIEGQEGVTWEQWVALARACEEAGIPNMFRSDHYMGLEAQKPKEGSLDAWATINALSAVTSTLRLGTLVSPVTFRHPAGLAKVVATADHVSRGRIELGLGAGWNEAEHEAYGFLFPPMRTRMQILEEQLAIVLGSWGTERFSFAGQHYTVRDLDALPKSIQKPHPPLILGGSGGPRSLALAARFADEYNSVVPAPEDVRARRDALLEACERAGRTPIPLSVMTRFVVGENDAALRWRVQRVAALLGLDPTALLEQTPPGWIVGTIEAAAAKLVALRDLGVSRVMCQHLLHDDLETVALIGRELAPVVA